MPAVLGFHDGTTLIYERWDPARAAPSGNFEAVAVQEISNVIEY